MGNRLAGVASVLIDGTSYALVGKLTYSPGSITRETLVGQDAVHGPKEMPRAPSMSMTIRDAKGMTVADFNAMNGVNVTGQLASGKVVIGAGMWTLDAQDVDTEDASFDLKFEGPTGSVTEN